MSGEYMENDVKHNGTEIQPDSEGFMPPMAEYTDPDELYEKLIATIRSYHPSDNLSMIERAYQLASKAHENQRRKSGEPYIIHPLCVALILAELRMDRETITAGLLHDVLEDTSITKEEMIENFGEVVTTLVDGVTKLEEVDNMDKTERQAENFRKMLLTMAQDIRVIIIKLADRLHNMRTLYHKEPDKQLKTAAETLDLYSPLAGKLGISKVKIELDDLAMKYVYPDETAELEEFLNSQKALDEADIQEMVARIQEKLRDAHIEADVRVHYKHLFTLYRNMRKDNRSLSQLSDYFAIRIITNSLRECYTALGVIHEHFTPVPDSFKDHIANPKENQYQSLHTILIDNHQKLYPIQIRTWDMERVANYGVAANWKYKGDANKQSEEEKFTWLNRLLTLQRESENSKEFIDSVKEDLNLFVIPIYCFTPTGERKYLREGSTVLDFAYLIHSAVGNCMVGAKVNGVSVPIDYVIKSGDIVEIQTSRNAEGPKPEWLDIAKTAVAKTKIKQWFKNASKPENIQKGKEKLQEICQEKGVNPSILQESEYTLRVAQRSGYHDYDSLLAAVGRGAMKEGLVINRLKEEYRRQNGTELEEAEAQDEKTENSQQVIVKDYPDIKIRISKCCSPVPGDEIVAYISKSRGAIIHRTDCNNILRMDDENRKKLCHAEWKLDSLREEDKEFSAVLEISARDRIALLADITTVFSEKGLMLTALSQAESKNNKAVMQLSCKVKSRVELQELMEALRRVDGVEEIKRSA
ncbi:MAG: RelA/SpoT family protein [Lachnospiraceae bacterium]